MIARFNGVSITDEDIRQVAGPSLAQAELQLYEARKGGIDQIIDDHLLEAEAQKKGVTKEDFLKKNIEDKITIKDSDIQKFYNEKKSQMGGKGLEDVKSNIRGYLYRDQHNKLYADLMKGLKKRAKVEILIKAPKVEVAEGDSPALGPKNAPVHLVEFTDYQCPFCGRARSTVNQVLEEYKGKIRYVLKDFPLSFHKDSEKAHEATYCAGEQGKYWEMNKKLWANQQKIKVEDLKQYAQELALKTAPFNDCLDSGKFAPTIQRNQSEGEKVGVSGTPAFFINGRMLSGARPFEAFKEVIDDELATN